jgi:hypothetical protein
MLSSRLYEQLDSNAVIPIIRNNPEAVMPAFLSGRLWEDFRDASLEESAYERLLRDIHGVAVDAVPPLGSNPFEGTHGRGGEPGYQELAWPLAHSCVSR